MLVQLLNGLNVIIELLLLLFFFNLLFTFLFLGLLGRLVRLSGPVQRLLHILRVLIGIRPVVHAAVGIVEVREVRVLGRAFLFAVDFISAVDVDSHLQSLLAHLYELTLRQRRHGRVQSLLLFYLLLFFLLLFLF